MKIDFAKTDRLIELIKDSQLALSSLHYKKAFDLKNNKNKKLRDLYDTLVKITESEKEENEKQNERIKAFAVAYGYENDISKGESFLKHVFDEENILKYLSRAYWQIQTFLIFQYENEDDDEFLNKDELISAISKQFPNEPYPNTIAEIILKKEPRKIDIEKEFWENCTDISVITEFCNIYNKRWIGYLKKVDTEYYGIDAILFNKNKNNELYQYFKDLRLCGLLRASEAYVELKLEQIAIQINMVCDGIVELFKNLRASTTVASIIDIYKTNSIENSISSKSVSEKKQLEIKTFDDLFKDTDWTKYVDVLTLCEPRLLEKKEDKYIFIGNKKTQKGCVAQWFKYLKNKGIINQSTNRDDLALVISSNIENYTIVGSSIDNESKTYRETFEEQLKKLLSMS